MTARLLCNTIWLQMRLVQRQLRLATNVLGNNYAAQARQLHVKTYDKDFKRDVRPNSYADDDDLEQPINAVQIAAAARAETLEKEQDDIFYGGEALQADADDLQQEQYEENPPNRRNRLRLIDYARMIKTHLSEKRLSDAIAVLEQRMQQDRIKPDKYIYNLLISACAKAGQTSKAFSLFTKMRQRGLDVTGGTYTSLFNACANCATPNYALERITHLREIMLEKQQQPNIKHYNAMIKAYGRCGDIKTAFQLMDELIEHKLPVQTASFNFLLQACASDTQLGFRHALLTWHKMLECKLRPDYYTFKSMLRCVRDCGFGNLNDMQQALEQILQTNNLQTLQSPKELSISDNLPAADNTANSENSALLLNNKTETQQLQVPNLLLPRPQLGSLIALAEVKLPHERFLLLGGITGYMEMMKGLNITPDIQLLTALLEVIPPTYAAEKQILSYIRSIGLKADIDFFNVLIKKRSMRFDYDGAQEVLSMIRTAGLHPDIVTYGVLALSCQTAEEARALLEQMQQQNIRINIQILGAMLRQGCAQKAFPYVTEILQLSLDEHIQPNDVFLKHLHKFYNECARVIDARLPYTKSNSFRKAHAKFCDKLRMYYEELGLSELKLEDKIKKIVAQNRNRAEPMGMEQLKNQQLARKQKERKYIKKIKLANLRNDEHIDQMLLEETKNATKTTIS